MTPRNEAAGELYTWLDVYSLQMPETAKVARMWLAAALRTERLRVVEQVRRGFQEAGIARASVEAVLNAVAGLTGEVCTQDDADRPCGRHLERGECSVHGRSAWPNPDACCSRNAFEDDAHVRTCPNWPGLTGEEPSEPG